MSSTELVRETGLSQMGAEPLSEAWTIQEFERKLVRRNSPIKSVLLDQKVVAGIGNIYADESLFRAGIHPERHASSLTSAEVSRLRDAIQTVLREAIDGGGTYSEEYVDVAGRPGRYTPRVYDRGAKPCMVCDTLLTRIRLGGRGTVYCSRCQPV